MKMNVLLINHYAGSLEMGMEFRPYYFAREWMKKGYNVTVIAGDYSHLRKKNPIVKKDFQIENIDGINYCWIKTGKYSGNGIKRALTMLRFCFKLFLFSSKISKTFMPDIVISSSTYPIDTFPAQLIAKKSKAKLIHEVHDMWPSTLIELGGMSKFNPFVVMMQIGENSAYKNSDYVVSLPPCAEAYMKKHGLKEGKFISIPNGIVMEDWENPDELPEEHRVLLDTLKKQGKFIVGYFGGHAISNALDSLVICAEKIEDDNVAFVLVGDGIEKNRLKNYAKENNIKNIYFLPSVSKKAIPHLLRYFSCAYIGAKNSPLYKFGLCMNKLFDSMYAGCPIILAIETPLDYVSKYECGITVEPENVEALIEGINIMKNKTQIELETMSNNGREAIIQNFMLEDLADKFCDLFK